MNEKDYQTNFESGISGIRFAGVGYKPVVGWWIIGDGFQVALYKKPTDEHIKNHYEMLGWEWKDAT